MKWEGYDSVTSWLVNIYCCIIYTLTLIPFRLFGLMFVSFIEHYETNREAASIPIVMYMLINCSLRPLIGMIGVRVGIENMVIIGSVLSSAGIAGCYLAHDIIGVSFSLGILYGVGVSCCNAFLPSIIKKHFTKNLTTANGIIFSGSCVVGIIIPSFAYFLLDLYLVSGTFLIVSGIMFHSVPVAILIWYASKMQEEIQKKRLQKPQSTGQNEISKLISCAERSSEIKLDYEQVRDTTIDLSDCASNNHTIGPRTAPTQKKKWNTLQRDTQLSISEYLSEEEKITSTDQVISESSYSKLSSFESEGTKYISTLTSPDAIEKEHFSAPVKKINLPKKSKDMTKKKFFNLDVFKEATFILIMSLVAVHTYVFVLSWTTMLDYSRDKSIARKYEQYFLMMQPLSNLATRLGLGWVVDKKYVSQNTYLIICFLLMALSTVCMILAHNFELLMTGILVFGASSGAVFPLFPVLIYEFVAEENQTVAQASQYFIVGIFIFTSTPLIGYFREVRGSYDGLYCIIAALCLVGCALVPVLFRLSKNTKEEKRASKETEKNLK